MAINHVTILGRMAGAAEIRTTNSGKMVTSFTVAVDNGKNQEPAWLDCIAWDQRAKFISDYFPKGRMIALEGRLQTRTWEDKQGNKRKATEIIVNNVSFCGDKDNAQGTNNGTASNFGGNDKKPFDFSSNDMDFRELPDDGGSDDLPF